MRRSYDAGEDLLRVGAVATAIAAADLARDDGGADAVFGTPVGRVDRKQIATFVVQHKHRRERQEENDRRKRSACHMSSRPAAPARRRKSRSSSEPAATSEHTSCPSAFQCSSSGSQSNCVRCSR